MIVLFMIYFFNTKYKNVNLRCMYERSCYHSGFNL